MLNSLDEPLNDIEKEISNCIECDYNSKKNDNDGNDYLDVFRWP